MPALLALPDLKVYRVYKEFKDLQVKLAQRVI